MIDILIVLDRSGSMESGRSDHEGGLNSFVEDQRSLDGDVRLTFVQFDGHNPFELVYDRIPLADVGRIHLIPRGSTPLFEAIGRAASHLETKQRTEPSELTIAMIITDGQNTDYHAEWTKDLVRAKVKNLEAAGWKLLFLGASIDAFAEGGSLGIGASHVANFSNSVQGSPKAAYAVVSNRLAAVRSANMSSQPSLVTRTMSFSPADYSKIDKGEAIAFDGGTSVLADDTALSGSSTSIHTTSTTSKE
jgi:hypothetical protein